MTPPPPAAFPKNAKEFMRAVYDLFRYKYPVYILESDENDGTYLVTWVDRQNKQRKSWLTQVAMNELTRDWVMN
jgi:hypothetical protein